LSARDAVETIKSFIEIGETIEELPQLTLPQYQQAALELAKVSFKISKAIEIAMSWITCFSTFQFIRNPSIGIDQFGQLAGKYNNLRAGNTFKKLDFACGDIASIYNGPLQNSLDTMFTDPSGSELDHVKAIFVKLSNSDNDMRAFVSEQIVDRLDSFVRDVQDILLDNNRDDFTKIKEAENKKLQFTRESRNIREQLTRMNDALNELVLKFARKTGTGISNIYEPKDFNETGGGAC
jgi:hypothetical protein